VVALLSPAEAIGVSACGPSGGDGGTSQSSCCRVCSTGKACGNSCVALNLGTSSAQWLRGRRQVDSRRMDSRWIAGIGIASGAWVMWQELTFRGSSTLTPVLFVIGLGIAALGVAHLVAHNRP
jgi:hypothetical protein